MAGAQFTIDLSVRQIEIPIGCYRTADPSPYFMKKVIEAYDDADTPGRAEILMKYAASWPRVCVSLADHNNKRKIMHRRKFMLDLRLDRAKRARVDGPLAEPASGAPTIIILPDMVRPDVAIPIAFFAMPVAEFPTVIPLHNIVINIDSLLGPDEEPVDAASDPYHH
jgi:hypothetical protein